MKLWRLRVVEEILNKMPTVVDVLKKSFLTILLHLRFRTAIIMSLAKHVPPTLPTPTPPSIFQLISQSD